MNSDSKDPLHTTLVALFQLPPDSDPNALTQKSIPEWDSFATVQIIMEIQNIFGVQFDVEEIEDATSYAALREILRAKGVSVMPCLPNGTG